MIPEKITHEHVVKAIEDIETKKVVIPPNRVSDNYDVEYNGKRYPPKFVISRANFYANGSEWPANAFNAIEAKTFLPTIGFSVKLKFDIKPGDILANQQISTLFQCGTQGGMRKSNKTNTLVIISDQTKPFYKDEWDGDIFNYTGMGLTGDQSIDYMQNKTLAESKTNGIEVHLFEVFTPGKYTYQGIVELASSPVMRTQKDKDGNNRKVVIFPVKLIDGKKSLSDSIVFAYIGPSNNKWTGYEDKDISLDYVPREAWNFYDFDDSKYFGYIDRIPPTRFNSGGLILLSSNGSAPNKRIFLGFYGNVAFGTFTLPVDISDTIINKEIQQQFKQKFTDPTILKTRQLVADKSLSTCYHTPIEFDVSEIVEKPWRSVPFMYVGEGNPISKENSKKLILKALQTMKISLNKANDSDKEKIKSDIEKTEKILDLYFPDAEENRAYWVVLPLSYQTQLPILESRLEIWQNWKEHGIVNIMWKKIVDKLGSKLLNFSSYNEYKSEYDQIYPNTQADMVWKFIYEMKEGDVILVPRLEQTILARGIIKSPAKIFDKKNSNSTEEQDFLSNLPLYREVSWEEISPEIPIPEDLKKKFGRGVNMLNKEDYDRLFSKEIKKKTLAMNDSKKQFILYGPPGTGKTYTSIIRAHEIIFGNLDESITFQTLQGKLQTEPGQKVDPTQISSWLKAIMLAFHEIQKEKVQVDEIRNSKVIEEYSLLTNNHTIRNTIWYTLQAESRLDSETVKQKRKTGDEYFDKDTESNWYLTEKGKVYLNSLIEDYQESPSTSISQFNFVTFHQSFSYEDFVEGIRPSLTDAEDSQIVYTVKDGIFKEICKKASLDSNNNYVLIIDEINRGNISKIFGELITLLEDNKRDGEREAITVRLPYSNQDFSVPSNVYIIGTMNSTDKSIALVDVALRRRFHFERLNVNYDLIQNEDAQNFLKDLNGIICALKNPDFEIGHSYFMTIPQTDERNEELKKVFTSKILPLIEEYFFNDWESLATILGTDSIRIEKRKKLVWDEDSGEFKKESEEFDRISGRCIDYSKDIFENTRRQVKNQQKAQETTKVS